jgi:hypothetical protein
MKTKKIFRPLSGWNLLLIISLVSVFSIIILSNINFPAAEAAGSITGRVFQDYNSNGAYDTASGVNSIDRGAANVTVTAYDSTGVSRGTTTTNASGNYTLTATGTGPYRLEFTDLPSGYTPSARSKASVLAGTTSNAGSTVQFVADGTTGNVNVGLVRSEDYCENNPSLVVSRFVADAQNGIYANNNVLTDFPYNAGTTYTDTTVANYDLPSTHSVGVIASRVGTVFSLAYSRVNRRVYAASYFKRHAGFGPGADAAFNTSDDAGAIYVVDPATNNVTATFTVPGATTNSHETNDYPNDNGDAGWNAVGKSSLGGIALADDESRLFVANLQNRRIYALNPTTGASLGNTVQMSTLTLPTPGGTNLNCAAGDIRPFAVKYYRGQVYVGMVCSAESTNGANDLFAYIFQLNPATLVFNAAPYYSVALNYTRGFADPGAAAEWRQWEPTIQPDFSFPQPMLTDIEFENDNLILGLRDREGDQALDNGPDAKRTAGDTLRGCGAMGAWIMESNGRCGSPATGAAPQGTGQGIGSGEFYHQDDFCLTPNGANFHDELAWGELIYIPGRQHVVTTLLDPISRTISSGATFDGGFRWFNNTTGNADRAYRLYNGSGGANVPDFGKANGLGGVTAMCGLAPIEIGNRVWRDLNGNGAQDPQESRAAPTPVLMSGVTVRLYNSSNAVVATAVTDQDGEYYFSSGAGTDTTNAKYNLNLQPNTQYQIRFDNPANYVAGGPLFGLFLSSVNQTSQNGDDESSDSDASNVTNPTGSPSGGTFPVISLMTGAVGSNNHTFDVGFTPVGPTAADVTVGGRVTNASGMGIANTTVTLADTTGSRRTALTNAFGYYQFTDVTVGQTVVVTVLSKRYHFSQQSQAIEVNEEIGNVNFVADN